MGISASPIANPRRQRQPLRSSQSSRSKASASISAVNAAMAYRDDDDKTERKSGKILSIGRGIFLTSLLVAAVLLGSVAYWGVAVSQKNLAQAQYESIAERALKEITTNAQRKQSGTHTMAAIVSQLLPDAAAYPFVAVPGFETLAQNVLHTGSNREFGFIPLVNADQQEAFEAFARDYYNGTIGQAPQAQNMYITQPEDLPPQLPNGQIWAFNKTTEEPYYVTTGEAYLDDAHTQKSNHTPFFTPILQHDSGPYHPVLLFNLRSEPERARQIEDILRCVQDRRTAAVEQARPSSSCVAITDIVTIRGQPPGTGPGAVVLQPIYPAHDPYEMTAILASPIVWDEVLQDVFATSVSGVDCVLETDQGTKYSYRIENGKVVAVGFGDYQSSKYEDYRRSIQISANEYTRSSPSYTWNLYPSDELYQSYKYVDPILAALSATSILVLTSIVFIAYDQCVRRVLSSKKELLHARRGFVRYISHEVRTPLNAVCMGLCLLQEQQAVAAGFARAELMAQYVDARQEDTHRAKNLADDTEDASFYDDTSSEPAKTSETDKEEADLLNKTLAAKEVDDFLLVQDILLNAQNSVDVLNGFLNYDRIESGTLKLELSVVDMKSLILGTTKEFQQTASKKELDLKVVFAEVQEEEAEHAAAANPGDVEQANQDTNTRMAENTAVIGDNVRLKQVIRNLISNALKFTKKGGKITVVVSYPPLTKVEEKRTSDFVMQCGETRSFTSCGHIQIKVKDTGVGMDSTQLQQLFHAGVQFNPNELQAGQGSGLGLFISKGIVEQHEGALEATSQGIGHGSVFTVTLPLHTVAGTMDNNSIPEFYRIAQECNVGTMESSARENNLMRLPLSHHRILIVDDALMNRKMMKRLLEHHGHICELAEDGVVAVKLVNDAMQAGKVYDTILMDYEMPNMSGPDATQKIREDGCDSFIIGVTGNLFPEDTQRFMISGANGVLAKPFKMGALESLWAEYNQNEPDSFSG